MFGGIEASKLAVLTVGTPLPSLYYLTLSQKLEKITGGCAHVSLCVLLGGGTRVMCWLMPVGTGSDGATELRVFHSGGTLHRLECYG